MTRKIRRTTFILLFSILGITIGATDLIILTDGSSVEGTVITYVDNEGVTILSDAQQEVFYESKSIRSIEFEYNVLGVSRLEEPRLQIIYHPRIRKGFYYIPPRFVIDGISYNMETEWGMESQVFECFSMLRERLDDGLFEETEKLMDELEHRMLRQSKIFASGAVMMASGVVLTWLPLNLDDIEATEPWAKGVSIGGIGINVAGLALLATQLFVDHTDYLQLIADSINAHIDT